MNTESRPEISTDIGQETPESNILSTARFVALSAAVIGAIGSVWLMLSIGSRAPLFLIILFIGWTLLPFAALAVANFISIRWSRLTRTMLYIITLVVALGSLALYADVVFRPPESTPASRWLIVPAASWLLMALAGAIALLISRRHSR